MSIYLAAETNTTIGNSSLVGAGFKCELGRKEMCDLKSRNSTLDPQADTMGYKSDPHKKSRTVINNWLPNETLINTYRYWNPYKKTYTYRKKDNKIRGRIDFCLNSPCLVVDFDFTYTTKGVGISRCPPNTHNYPNYQKLIRNTIKLQYSTQLRKKTQTKM